MDPRLDQRLARRQGPASPDLTGITPDLRAGKDPTGPWNPAPRRDDRIPGRTREQETMIKKPEP
jgi:hypothetical protein